MMASEQMRRDLSRNLQNQLGQVFERNMKIADHVLDNQQMAELMFEAAVMMIRSTAASIATIAGTSENVATLYDSIIDGMMAAERSGRTEALRRAVERKGAPI